MAAPVQLQLHGNKQLMAAIKSLDVKVQRRVLRNALRVNAKTALNAIRKRTPVGTDTEGRKHLRDLLKLVTRSRRGRITVAVAGPTREELGIGKDEPYYWPFAVEYGHAAAGKGTYANAKGQTVAKRQKKTAAKDVRPYPFIRPGWDSAETAMASRLTTDILDGVAKEWAKG